MIVVGHAVLDRREAHDGLGGDLRQAVDTEMHAGRIVLAERARPWYSYCDPVEQNTKPRTPRHAATSRPLVSALT